MIRGRRTDLPALILAQLASPIVLILLAATGIAFFLGDASDAAIVLAIVAVSAALGVWQERGASRAGEALLAQVATRVQVVRGGQTVEVPIADIVSPRARSPPCSRSAIASRPPPAPCRSRTGAPRSRQCEQRLRRWPAFSA